MLETLGTTSLAVVRTAANEASAFATIAFAWIAAQPVWMTATAFIATKVMAIALVVAVRRRREQARRVAVARRRAARVRRPGHAVTLDIKPREYSRPVARQMPRGMMWTPPSTAQALELVQQGLPEVEVSRRSGLSRDAVSLLLVQRGREARKGTPGAAVVAASKRSPGPFARFEARA
jgi:hypothetical protein